MNQALVDKIVQAVLYEGYILYPYRPSVKNHQRWSFGGLYPQSYSDLQHGTDAWKMQTQCLLQGTLESVLNIRVRFLHLMARTVGKISPPLTHWPDQGEPPFEIVQTLEVAGKQYQNWQEAVEREIVISQISLNELLAESRLHPFVFPPARTLEPLNLSDGRSTGVLIRQQQALAGSVEISAQLVADGLYKISVQIMNRTPLDFPSNATRDEALMRSLVSTHTILNVQQGQFVSSIDPPQQWRTVAAQCKNVGAWPVLVGDAGETDTMLSSPIILYDYPQIAPESPGDLFDATEIDEILTLRIMTLTEDEKKAATAIDERAGAMLARTEALAREQLMGLHGTFRGLQPTASMESIANWDPMEEKQQLERTLAAGIELKPGDRVVLHPSRRADIFDMALDGMSATVVAIEQDYENRIHVAVTVDDDPGKDLGQQGKIGHRFFFGVDEVVPV